MPRRFNRPMMRSARKDRMWFTAYGEVFVQVGQGLVAAENAILTLPSAGALNFLEGGTAGATPYATREFTVAAMHLTGTAYSDLNAGTPGSPPAIVIAVGVQGGGAGGVSQLPEIAMNEQTGMWPCVAPAIVRAEGNSFWGYSIESSAGAQRKVKLGQPLYLSMAVNNQSVAATDVRARVWLRALALL